MSETSKVPRPEDVPVLSIDEVAEILGLSRSVAYREVAAGRIPSLQYGRRRLVSTAVLRQSLGIDAPRGG